MIPPGKTTSSTAQLRISERWRTHEIVDAWSDCRFGLNHEVPPVFVLPVFVFNQRRIDV
jgi:hypothetical protein